MALELTGNFTGLRVYDSHWWMGLMDIVREKNNLQAHRIVTSSKVFLENECRTHRG